MGLIKRWLQNHKIKNYKANQEYKSIKCAINGARYRNKQERSKSKDVNWISN